MTLRERIKRWRQRRKRDEPHPPAKRKPPPERQMPPPEEDERDTPDDGELGIYARKSPPKDPRLIAVQTDQLQRAYDGQVKAVFVDDGVRGDVHWTQRPGLSKLVYAICDGTLSGIAIECLDRLARGVIEQEEILDYVWQHGGRVLSVREGEILPDAPGCDARANFRRQQTFVHEQELRLRRERQRRGLDRARAAGRYTGGVPRHRKYGYQLVKFFDPARGTRHTWEPIEEEMRVVWEIHDRAGSELTYEQMASELNERRVPTVEGGPWRKWTVRKIAIRPEPVLRDGKVVVAIGRKSPKQVRSSRVAEMP